MFFPYRAQIALHRFPIITILLSLVSIGIYVAQAANERTLLHSAMAFCQKPYERGFKQALVRLTGEADPSTCAQALLGIHLAKDRHAEIAGIARQIGGVEGVSNMDLSSYYEDALFETYRAFSRTAPDHLTARLWYPPNS